MLTSPPYPNHRDFATMFRPERAFLDWLDEERGTPPRQASDHIIGSNFVAGRPDRVVKTKAAKDFLEAVGNLKRAKRARYDDDKYYIPFFANYFADLEDAIANIRASLQSRFEGYLILVNNTHRNILVPVSETSLEGRGPSAIDTVLTSLQLSSKDAVRENYSELLEAKFKEIGLPLRPSLQATFEAEARWRGQA